MQNQSHDLGMVVRNSQIKVTVTGNPLIRCNKSHWMANLLSTRVTWAMNLMWLRVPLWTVLPHMIAQDKFIWCDPLQFPWMTTIKCIWRRIRSAPAHKTEHVTEVLSCFEIVPRMPLPSLHLIVSSVHTFLLVPPPPPCTTKKNPPPPRLEHARYPETDASAHVYQRFCLLIINVGKGTHAENLFSSKLCDAVRKNCSFMQWLPRNGPLQCVTCLEWPKTTPCQLSSFVTDGWPCCRV